MAGAIDRIARNLVEIAESLRQIAPGALRCLRCGHTADASDFRIAIALRPRGRHRDRRLCPSCQADINVWGYVDHAKVQNSMDGGR